MVKQGQYACERYGISAYAYMAQIKSATRRIEEMSHRARRYREMACRATGSMETAHAGGGGNESRIEKNISSCMDLAADIEKRARMLRERYETASGMIDGVVDDVGREVLELRYLSDMRWEEIAARMCYSERQIRRAHKKALEDVQAQMDARGIKK